MKLQKLLLAVLLVLIPVVRVTALTAPEPFWLGADVSWVTEMEKKGETWATVAGEPRDCFALMKDYGLNAVRLRVWVDPREHGNWCDVADTCAKAKRAKAAGQEVMIDFHYSDWWADPAHQTTPAAWREHDLAQLGRDVAAHTESVLKSLKAAGVEPRWIQIGNETTNGFLWPLGRATDHPAGYAQLFKAGYEAAKRVCPSACVMVHLDGGHNAGRTAWNLGLLAKGGAKWDAIGLSLYPWWCRKEIPDADKVVTDCMANIRALGVRWQCPVVIAEVGFDCTPPAYAEGRRLLARVVREARTQTEGVCRGVFYWEPECRPSKYRLGAFDERGRPTPIMEGWREGVLGTGPAGSANCSN